MKLAIALTLILFQFTSIGQTTIEELTKESAKGDYAILEVRLNIEDEFRTLEGRDHDGLSRIALYMGRNKGKEVLVKGFEGYNQIVTFINKLKEEGWGMVSTYPINGKSLLITHYVFQKGKK